MTVKYVKFNAKHSDMADLTLLDEDYKLLEKVEEGLPYVGLFGGDYTYLVIENETGRIVGWKPISSLNDV